MNSKRVWLSLLCAVITGGLLAGCGGVDVERSGDEPLKLLDLSPRADEVGVSADTDVVAVFSQSMNVGEGADKLNEQTFYVEDSLGQAQSAVAVLSTLDPEDATAVISLAGLDAGGQYTIVLKGSLQGAAGAPLGVDIDATFTVAE